jgi:superfamily II DNA or RNA helicase
MDVFAKREVYDGVVNKYLKFGTEGGKAEKAICFNVNIEHSVEVCRRFLEVGVNAEHVDGETPGEERKAILSRFQTGQTQVLCNVGIVTTGYDEPSVEIIIVNRATTSLPLWLQMAGRGSRIFGGKDRFKLIDMGENWKHLGLWEDERDWKDMFHNPVKEKKKGANDAPAPVKDCPECDALLNISVRFCPHCGHEFPPLERVPNIVQEVEFDLISSVRPKDWGKLTIEELVKLQTIKEYKAGWLLHQLRERANGNVEVYERLIRELAAYKNYKKGWIPRELENYSSQKSA